MVAMLVRFSLPGSLFLAVLFLAASTSGRSAAQDILVAVYAPLPGEAVQGQVPVDVGIQAPGYSGIELEFSYTGQGDMGWFLIAESDQVPFDGILAQWDTTQISDGEYDMRLVVLAVNAEPIIYTVTGLRVRNYSPIETETPTPILPTETLNPGQSTPEPSPSPTSLAPTVTPLPTNPAVFTNSQFIGSLTLGGGIILLVFISFGLYLGLRNAIRSR